VKNIDLESLRISGHLESISVNDRRKSVSAQRPKPPQPKAGTKFLKGPIPVDWLQSASRLPGKTTQVAIALWFQAGLTKCAIVRLSMKRLSEFGVKRHSAYRALEKLETGGLVSVERHQGRLSIVTLLDAPGEEPDGE
jgi:hypothetical protein